MYNLSPYSLDETKSLATQIALVATSGDVITLQGDLGAGKSEFARAFIQALVGPQTVVPSPTFTIMEVYDGPLFQISHLDLYRMESPDELIEIGFDEALAKGVTLIEWPERLGGYVLSHCLKITIKSDASEVRNVVLIGDKHWDERLCKFLG